jgi:hypothetical protein
MIGNQVIPPKIHGSMVIHGYGDARTSTVRLKYAIIKDQFCTKSKNMIYPDDPWKYQDGPWDSVQIYSDGPQYYWGGFLSREPHSSYYEKINILPFYENDEIKLMLY